MVLLLFIWGVGLCFVLCLVVVLSVFVIMNVIYIVVFVCYYFVRLSCYRWELSLCLGLLVIACGLTL